MAPPKAAQLQKGRGLNLAKPFDQDTRRILEKTVNSLLRKRGKVDSKMTKVLERLGQSSDVQYQQESLLQFSLRMKAKEIKFIRRQSKVLNDRQKLLDMDPSDARARDVDLLKSLLSRLIDEVSTSSEEPKQNSKDGDISSIDWDSEDSADEKDGYHNALENDLSASPMVLKANEKRKRDDDTPQSSKKKKNGHIGKDTTQSALDITPKGEFQPLAGKGEPDSGDKPKKKHGKSESISFNEMNNEEQHDSPKTNSGGNTNQDVEHGGNTGSDYDLTKAQKKKKKSKSGVAHVIKHGIESGATEAPSSHQKAEVHKNAFASTVDIKGGRNKKKHKRSHSIVEVDFGKEEQGSSPRVATTAEVSEENKSVPTDEVKNDKRKKKQNKSKYEEFAHTIPVIDDVKEQKRLKVAEASPGSKSAKNSEALMKDKKPKTEKNFVHHTTVRKNQAKSEPEKSVHNTVVAELTIIQGRKKKKKLRSKSLVFAKEDDHAVTPDKTEDMKHSIHDSQKATLFPNATLKGPTPIHPPLPPVTPVYRGPFIQTAGRALFNPFSNLKPFSIQHLGPSSVRSKTTESTEESPKVPDGQTWVLDTTGSRKRQKKSHGDDAKSVTMTIGKVDTPHKVDQGSPTPPPKKEQKKRGRPLAPMSSQPAISAGQMSITGVRASSDLAALLGNPKRAKKLQKVLKEDKATLEQEKKSWFEAMGFQYKD
ncbi:hypothetical protein CORC01_14019 [Colletotrichum orchidophilum]|uniref:Uncharacterized protein n=1 Tax=Colletotrichum orchidophilum TaxID=1209926 RepID=A0A1G4AND4_9PEZI|nr:uncharacterized protein CORC01_14019 [Colletotrichum orchidophilum]OHE90690.1 hypothetical protein CORC01_14019 [Colletotrichum orchidophilum]